MVLTGIAFVALLVWFLHQRQQHSKRQIAELAGILSALRRISAALDLGVSASVQRPAEPPAPVKAPAPAEPPAPAGAASEAREGDRPSIEEPTQLMTRGDLAAFAAELAPAEPVAAKLEPDEPSRKPPPPSLAPVTPTRLSSQAQKSAAPSLPASSPHPRAT